MKEYIKLSFGPEQSVQSTAHLNLYQKRRKKDLNNTTTGSFVAMQMSFAYRKRSTI